MSSFIEVCGFIVHKSRIAVVGPIIGDTSGAVYFTLYIDGCSKPVNVYAEDNSKKSVQQLVQELTDYRKKLVTEWGDWLNGKV